MMTTSPGARGCDHASRSVASVGNSPTKGSSGAISGPVETVNELLSPSPGGNSAEPRPHDDAMPGETLKACEPDSRSGGKQACAADSCPASDSPRWTVDVEGRRLWYVSCRNSPRITRGTV